MTLDTAIILDLLRTAYVTDRDMAAACAHRIEGNLVSIRRARKVIRTMRTSPGLREMSTKRADRLVRDNRRCRQLAKTYNWNLTTDRSTP